MRDSSDKIEGPCVIDGDVKLHGMITGDATLASGVALLLHGMVTGNLIVQPGAIAVVHGMVSGKLINQGADVTIYGTVGGLIDADLHRATKIMPGAIVGP